MSKRRCQHCDRDTVAIHARGLCSRCYVSHRDEYPATKIQRPFTARERDVIRRDWGRRSPATIAAELGRDVQDVYSAATRFGAAEDRRRFQKTTDAIRQKIYRLHDRGLSDREIGAVIHKSHATVGRWLRRAGKSSNCRSAPTEPFPARARERMRQTALRRIRAEGVDYAVGCLRKHLEGRIEATRMGWPQAETLLEGRILDCLFQHGPSTGAQIGADLASASPWTLQVLRGLKRRGLVVVRWRERGHVCVYSLARGLRRSWEREAS